MLNSNQVLNSYDGQIKTPAEKKNVMEKLLMLLQTKERTNTQNFGILKILQRFPELDSSLLSQIRELKNDNDILLSVMDKFKLETVQKGESVYIQGDRKNKKFYFVLSGQVSFLMKKSLKSLYNHTEARRIKGRPLSQTHINIEPELDHLLTEKEKNKLTHQMFTRKITQVLEKSNDQPKDCRKLLLKEQQKLFDQNNAQNRAMIFYKKHKTLFVQKAQDKLLQKDKNYDSDDVQPAHYEKIYVEELDALEKARLEKERHQAVVKEAELRVMVEAKMDELQARRLAGRRNECAKSAASMSHSSKEDGGDCSLTKKKLRKKITFCQEHLKLYGQQLHRRFYHHQVKRGSVDEKAQNDFSGDSGRPSWVNKIIEIEKWDIKPDAFSSGDPGKRAMAIFRNFGKNLAKDSIQ
jgi:hypothetical protein